MYTEHWGTFSQVIKLPDCDNADNLQFVSTVNINLLTVAVWPLYHLWLYKIIY